MEIGVISDTHLSSAAAELPSQLIEELKKVDLIIHAGDLTEQKIYDDLKSINEVKAVAGNMDSYQLKNKLNEKITFTVDGKQI